MVQFCTVSEKWFIKMLCTGAAKCKISVAQPYYFELSRTLLRGFWALNGARRPLIFTLGRWAAAIIFAVLSAIYSLCEGRSLTADRQSKSDFKNRFKSLIKKCD